MFGIRIMTNSNECTFDFFLQKDIQYLIKMPDISVQNYSYIMIYMRQLGLEHFFLNW